jgi:hypothetical protein
MPISEQNPEECDATDDASSTAVGVKNPSKPTHFLPNFPILNLASFPYLCRPAEKAIFLLNFD